MSCFQHPSSSKLAQRCQGQVLPLLVKSTPPVRLDLLRWDSSNSCLALWRSFQRSHCEFSPSLWFIYRLDSYWSRLCLEGLEASLWTQQSCNLGILRCPRGTCYPEKALSSSYELKVWASHLRQRTFLTSKLGDRHLKRCTWPGAHSFFAVGTKAHPSRLHDTRWVFQGLLRQTPENKASSPLRLLYRR